MKYEPSLDGLRAVAITAVVVFHVYPQLLPGGWAGVDMFFVLSGYLITSLLMRELSASGSIGFRQFYMRRFLRLAPAYLCLLVAELVHAAFSPLERADILKAVMASAAYLMNWNRAFDWFPQAELGHTWSLSMEEQFYILWPLTLAFIYKRSPAKWVLAALAAVTIWRSFLALSGADPERTYNGFDTHSDSLLAGCAIALVPMRPFLEKLKGFSFIPVLLVALIFLFMQHRNLATQTIGLGLSAFCSAWMVVAALQDGLLKRILSLGTMTYTGRISYGWYLWHYPMLLLMAPYNTGGGGAIIIGASYLAAAMSHRFIEAPCLRLKSRFEPSCRRAFEMARSPIPG